MGAVDRDIARLAAGQHGMVALWQLVPMGVSAAAAKRRVADGRLLRRHQGVYSVGPVTTARGRWMAAILALGPRAVLSHREAAALHDLRGSQRRATDVTV